MSSEAGVASGGFTETGEYLRFTEFLASCVRYRYVGVCVGPPEVILFLRGMLPDDQYYRLLDQTPRLADIAARQHIKTS